MGEKGGWDVQKCQMKTRLCDAAGPRRRAPQPGESYLLADEVLQHRALARALAAHHGDLGQVQVCILADGGEGILHAVHQRNQILHPPVPHLCDAPGSLFLQQTREGCGSCLPLLATPSRLKGVFRTRRFT